MSRYVALALFFATAVAHAEPPKLAALTKTYADKHGFAVRVVKSDLGTRQVERHFVPVLPTTHDDFLATFSKGNGAVVWKTNANDKVHGMMSFGPGDVVSHGNRHGGNEYYGAHAIGAGYLTMALEPHHIDAWNGFIDKFTAPGSHPYAGAEPGVNKFTAAQTAAGLPAHGGCMWWVVHADVGGGQNLAHLMGVRRAKGPEVLGPRLVHSGNERVGPIGIPVNSIAEFNAMTDSQLMGPEPAGGAAEQVKE
ncbi:MAG: hypothetical protein ABI321_06010 [Polyangia bacterium]